MKKHVVKHFLKNVHLSQGFVVREQVKRGLSSLVNSVWIAPFLKKDTQHVGNVIVSKGNHVMKRSIAFPVFAIWISGNRFLDVT
jgi:hypothetical protein